MSTAVIRQGDKYSIPFKIKKSDTETYLTPVTCTGVKIKIGKMEKTNLTWDSNLQAWLFPLTQENTYNLKGVVYAQCQVLINNDIISSTAIPISVDPSIINSIWDTES